MNESYYKGQAYDKGFRDGVSAMRKSEVVKMPIKDIFPWLTENRIINVLIVEDIKE